MSSEATSPSTSPSTGGLNWLSVQRVLVLAADQPEAVEPALGALRTSLPQAEVDLAFANTVSAPIAAIHCWPYLENGIDEQHQALEWMRQQQFDAAFVFCSPNHSPFALAYLCYLAGIPVRVGMSREFGGKVLSHCFDPPDQMELVNPHLHLLEAAGIKTERRGQRAAGESGSLLLSSHSSLKAKAEGRGRRVEGSPANAVPAARRL